MCSKAAGLQPVLDLRQAVGAEEGFTIDNDVRRAEDAGSQRLLAFLLEAGFHFRSLQCGGQLFAVDAESVGDVEHGVR